MGFNWLGILSASSNKVRFAFNTGFIQLVAALERQRNLQASEVSSPTRKYTNHRRALCGLLPCILSQFINETSVWWHQQTCNGQWDKSQRSTVMRPNRIIKSNTLSFKDKKLKKPKSQKYNICICKHMQFIINICDYLKTIWWTKSDS